MLAHCPGEAALGKLPAEPGVGIAKAGEADLVGHLIFVVLDLCPKLDERVAHLASARDVQHAVVKAMLNEEWHSPDLGRGALKELRNSSATEKKNAIQQVRSAQRHAKAHHRALAKAAKQELASLSPNLLDLRDQTFEALDNVRGVHEDAVAPPLQRKPSVAPEVVTERGPKADDAQARVELRGQGKKVLLIAAKTV